MSSKRRLFGIVLLLVLATLAACGGSSGGAAPAATYTIGGTLNGLTGTGLVLQNNAADDLAVSADGTFTFVTPSATYAVSVKSQPGNPVQTCTVNSGSGTASANVTGVTVTCSTNAYSVGGSVSGLAGTGLVLQDNSGDDLAITGNGAFTFATSVASGANYTVTVKTQPTLISQTCTVTNGSGAVTGASIGGVAVNCVTPVPRFVYVANSSDNTISIYSVDAASGQMRHNGYVLTGTAPQSVTVDPFGKFAYVANNGSSSISGYSIAAGTGALTPVPGSPFAAGTNPYSVSVAPSGKFAYVANFGSASVSAYTIDAASGVLAQVDADAGTAGMQNFATGSQPLSVTVDPSGKFAFVAANGGDLWAYTINAATGALASAGTIAVGSPLRSVIVDPSGKFAYAVDAAGISGVLAYSINATTGVLTPVAGSPFTAGDFPISITVDPSGKFAYVANYTSGNVSAYAINATTGALSSAGTVAAGSNPSSINIDPSGKFAYVTNQGSNTVSAYAINAANGSLTALPTVAARAAPTAMAMVAGTAAVTHTPKFAYVANYGPGSVVSAYTINATTGALTALADTPTLALGTSVAVDPSGKFAYTTHEILVESPTQNVSTYTIGASGALTRVGAAAAVGANPSDMAVEPSGRFAYVANQAAYNLSVHTVDATTGALTWIGSAAADIDPSAVAVDPSGRFVYVANNYYSNPGSGSVTAYTIAADSGALSAIDLNGALAGTALTTGPNPTGITVDPSGRFVYVTHANGVQSYEIQLVAGAQMGAGALINASAAVAGANPRAIAVEPAGKFAYVANTDSNNVSVYTINSVSGALTGAGTVAGTGSGAYSVTVEKSGKFAYVTNRDSNNVSAYSINVATGTLTGVGFVPAGTAPASMTTTGAMQ